MSEIVEDKIFENSSFAEQQIKENVYENCTFLKCDFSNAKLISCQFIDCFFVDCNLSMIDLNRSTLYNVEFKNSKILGVKFNRCNDFIFEVTFINCILDYSSFEKRKMKQTLFKDSSLKGVDFLQADLSQSSYTNCNLEDAVFYHSNLQEVDFTSSYNYNIDLDENNIKKARFSKEGLLGLLNKYNIIIE